VSHIGPADPNMSWLTTSIAEADKQFPVTVKYVAPETFSVEAQVNLLETAIAAKPDGLIVPITDATALQGPLNRAIASGIPVIASNIPDTRPVGQRIPYLTYVGGDEYQTGVLMAQEILQQAKPNVPRRVACAIGDVGHAGAELRCKGLTDGLKSAGVPVDRVAITDEPSTITNVMRSYLVAHKDTDAIWSVTLLTAPFVYKVVQGLGMLNQVKMAVVDESPLAIEGILQGKLIATHSQQFWLQGYLPVMWLYLYKKYGYVPPPTELVGPVIIDKTNAAQWRTKLINIFGQQEYNKLAAGWNQ
jgi:simple sugar transport system substrate-binding protein